MSLVSNLINTFNQLGQLAQVAAETQNQSPTFGLELKNKICTEIVNAIASELSTGVTTSVYSGGGSMGVVTATVSTVPGTSVINTAPGVAAATQLLMAALDLIEASKADKSQDWADAISNAVEVITKGSIVSESISGFAIPPVIPPPTVPVVGAATGVLNPVGLDLLKLATVAPAPITNEAYATQLSVAILAYWATTPVNMSFTVPAALSLSGVGTLVVV